jgi:transcriptional regulator with XRE-family HTH domain
VAEGVRDQFGGQELRWFEEVGEVVGGKDVTEGAAADTYGSWVVGDVARVLPVGFRHEISRWGRTEECEGALWSRAVALPRPPWQGGAVRFRDVPGFPQRVRLARSIITARQERLGAELRKLRERAGLSGREAARMLGIAESKLSATEVGRVGVSADRVRYLASQYTCDDAALVEALVAMATERGRGRGLLPRGFLDLAELEHHTRSVRSFEIVNIPGLLRCEEHVRALYEYSPLELSQEQQELRVRFRLRRQEVLGRDDFVYDAVIHEAALRIRKADRGVARRQLQHILEQAERPQATVRVVPFDRDGFRNSSPILLLAGPVPQLDTVLRDAPHGGAFLDAEAQLATYRRWIAEAQKAALGVVESRDFIYDMGRQI